MPAFTRDKNTHSKQRLFLLETVNEWSGHTLSEVSARVTTIHRKPTSTV